MGQLVGIDIRRTAGRVMDVMKLAHVRDPRERHLEKSHSRDHLDRGRGERLGNPIHVCAPRPEIFVRSLRVEKLGLSTERTLESVAVRVHETGYDGHLTKINVSLSLVNPLDSPMTDLEHSVLPNTLWANDVSSSKGGHTS